MKKLKIENKLNDLEKILEIEKNELTTLPVTNKILYNHGFVQTLSSGIITAKGLKKVASGELVKVLGTNIFAIALNLTSKGVGLVLCGSDRVLKSGTILIRTGTLISLPVSFSCLGLAINPLGYKLGQNILYSQTKLRRVLEAPAPVFLLVNQFLNLY